MEQLLIKSVDADIYAVAIGGGTEYEIGWEIDDIEFFNNLWGQVAGAVGNYSYSHRALLSRSYSTKCEQYILTHAVCKGENPFIARQHKCHRFVIL